MAHLLACISIELIRAHTTERSPKYAIATNALLLIHPAIYKPVIHNEFLACTSAGIADKAAVVLCASAAYKVCICVILSDVASPKNSVKRYSFAKYSAAEIYKSVMHKHLNASECRL